MSCYRIVSLNDKIRRIRREPHLYLGLASELKSRLEVAKAALIGSATLENLNLQRRIIDTVFEFKPHPCFPASKSIGVCSQVLDISKPEFVEIYLQNVGPYLVQYAQQQQHLSQQEWDDLNDLFLRHPSVFHALSRNNRADPAILKLAIENFHRKDDLEMILLATPSEVFIENPHLIVALLRRCLMFCDESTSHWHMMTAEVWRNTTLVHQMVVSVPDIPCNVFPEALRSDRDFFLRLFEEDCYPGDLWETNIPNIMSDALKCDKGFMIECVKIHPFMLFHCGEKLQADVDIFVEAAERAIRLELWSNRFVDDLGDHRLLRIVKAMQVRMQSLDFMTFLGCCWKCSQDPSIQGHPLQLLDCGPETSISFKNLIRSYAGAEPEGSVTRMTAILESVASMVIDQKDRPLGVIQTIPQEILLNTLHRKLISNTRVFPGRCTIPVSNVPQEFWSDRDFVLKWVKCYGQAHNLIPVHFKEDLEICLAYYRASECAVTTFNASPTVLRDCIAWISETRMKDKTFVLRCALMNPIFLNYCSDDVRLDLDFLIDFAYCLCYDKNRKGEFEIFADTAINGCWGEALIRLVNGLRDKVVDYHAFFCFTEVMRDSEMSLENNPILEIIQSYACDTQERIWKCLRLLKYPSIKNHLAKVKSVTDLELFAVDGAPQWILIRQRCNRPG